MYDMCFACAVHAPCLCRACYVLCVCCVRACVVLCVWGACAVFVLRFCRVCAVFTCLCCVYVPVLVLCAVLSLCYVFVLCALLCACAMPVLCLFHIPPPLVLCLFCAPTISTIVVVSHVAINHGFSLRVGCRRLAEVSIESTRGSEDA